MHTSAIQIERSGTLNLFNRAGGVAMRLGVKPWRLEPSRVLEIAQKRTGFAFEGECFEEALNRLAESLEGEAGLNTFGRLALHQTLRRSAEARFLVEREIAKNPEILNERIEEPVFVVGMPRTGTTTLQALLHEDSKHRSPLSWECLLPYPAPTMETYRANERIENTRKDFAQLVKLVPDFKKKHYMEADAPQECLTITAHNFTSFQFTTQCYLPSYQEWFVEDADQLENMRWHKRFLQFLQSGGIRGRRWLLKSPVHMMRLKALFEVYPDARVIMTHRSPEDVVPSTTSLISSVRGLFSDEESANRTANEHLLLWADFFNRFLTDRREINREHQFIDVRFEEFVADQMRIVDRIYSQFGWQLDGQSRTRMCDFLQTEPKDKHGKHEYSLEQMGLHRSDVQRLYSNYLDFLGQLNPCSQQS